MNRKDDHIRYALDQQERVNDFDKVRFVHTGLSSLSLDSVDLSVTFCGERIKYPIYINAMTGGSKRAFSINQKLARLARHFQIPIASGSVSIALKDKSVEETFSILRKENPDGFILANMGADKTLDDAKRAIDLLQADALQIHINQVQELLMSEGERNFSSWKENIKKIVRGLKCPVIVKEVGFGMSHDTFEALKELGVSIVDVAGKGGTNFARIENARTASPLEAFESWGNSTVESLLEATKVEGLTILASGGIRNGLDVAKALALGAKAVGLSGFFLKLVETKTEEEAILEVEKLLHEIKVAMVLVGASNVPQLKQTNLVVNDEVFSFMKQRDIDICVLKSRFIDANIKKTY